MSKQAKRYMPSKRSAIRTEINAREMAHQVHYYRRQVV